MMRKADVVEGLLRSMRETQEVIGADVIARAYGVTPAQWDRAFGRRVPLHRLRYRWSLRRRAPAWRQRAARRRPRMILRATGDWLNTKTGEVTLLHPKTLALCRRHDQQAAAAQVIAVETAKLDNHD